MAKVRIFRVITSAEVVDFHLRNFLINGATDFDIYVVGNNVSRVNHKLYPGIKWIDLDISRKISVVRDFLCLIKLIFLIINKKPLIIHSIMPKAGLISSLAGFICKVPTRIHTFTGQVWSEESGLKRKVLISIDRLIVFLTTRSYTDSRSQSSYLLDNGISKNGKALPYLGYGSLSGVDFKRFNYESLMRSRENMRNELGVSGIVYIFVGRKCRDKGVFNLITSFMKLMRVDSSIFLILVGPDETNGELDEKIKQLNCDNIVLIPATSEPEKYIIAADVFCLPSYREGFGSVVIEAAALKRPCIGTRISGLSDSVVDGETGLLVSSGNTEELYAAMHSFISEPMKILNMGEAAYSRTLKCFSSDYLYELQVAEY
ncbi:glycosyltransferase [Chitinimonas sp. BJB300]|uniref:glycosyltransferase n=1 Tax=Chitinimonas sp. BJB300 TaxID=1559339 RepID=UPI000C10AA6B|nr:glycosyltransferase [Chitinimonas sp. BJB300]PHV11156.1 glycosyltransferase family 1 protein [Chitinimonas sp. BJB300]TSJ85560.1 glycosyltransferase family 1 protein [Chitinimonas sp. BJB300]